MDELSEKLIETAVKETIQPIYQDTLSPTLREIGKIAQDAVKTIKLVTAPIQYGAYLQTRLEKHLEKSLKNISKEELVKPHDSIQIPIFEQLRNYNTDEINNEKYILDMYHKLLESAYNKNTSALVHPKFSVIISQLSPDEAILFKRIGRGGIQSSSIDVLSSNFSELQNKQYTEMYFNNLEKLGLITINDYKDMCNFSNGYEFNEDKGITIIDYKVYLLTEFGLLFYNLISRK